MSNKRSNDALSSNTVAQSSMIEDTEEHKTSSFEAASSVAVHDSKRARTDDSSAASSSAAASSCSAVPAVAATQSSDQTESQLRAHFAQLSEDLIEGKFVAFDRLFEPFPSCPWSSPLHGLWLPSLHGRLEQMAPSDPYYTRTVSFLVMMYSMRTDAISEDESVELVDRLLEMQVADDLELQETFAHASVLCPTTHLPKMMPRLVPILTSSRVLPGVFATILESAHSIVTAPETLALLAQPPVAPALVRHLSPDAPATCIMVATIVQCLIASSTEELPFLDRLLESGLCDVARLTALLKCGDGLQGSVLDLIHQLQAEMDVESLIIELIPALIPRLSGSNEDDRFTATSILCNCIHDANRAEERVAILGSNLIPHLISRLRPERAEQSIDDQLLEFHDLDRPFPAIVGALNWPECAVGNKFLHPFVAQIVQMRLVPVMEALIQAPLNPAVESHLSRLHYLATFLGVNVYDRLPADLSSSPLHLGLNTQASIHRRWSAAAKPHWFNARRKYLAEQRFVELMRIQQAAEAADEAEEEDEEGAEEDA